MATTVSDDPVTRTFLGIVLEQLKGLDLEYGDRVYLIETDDGWSVRMVCGQLYPSVILLTGQNQMAALEINGRIISTELDLSTKPEFQEMANQIKELARSLTAGLAIAEEVPCLTVQI